MHMIQHDDDYETLAKLIPFNFANGVQLGFRWGLVVGFLIGFFLGILLTWLLI